MTHCPVTPRLGSQEGGAVFTLPPSQVKENLVRTFDPKNTTPSLPRGSMHCIPTRILKAHAVPPVAEVTLSHFSGVWLQSKEYGTHVLITCVHDANTNKTYRFRVCVYGIHTPAHRGDPRRVLLHGFAVMAKGCMVIHCVPHSLSQAPPMFFKLKGLY